MYRRYQFAVFFLLATIPLLLFAADKKDKKSAGSSADKKSASSSAQAFIKEHAAKEFGGSKDQVSVKDVGVIDGKQEYEVRAAGQTVRYRFGIGKISTTATTVCVCCYIRIDGTCGCLDCHNK